jgi:hypothetical protein
MGLLSGDYRRDYLHLTRAVETLCGRVALGCFATRATFEKLGQRDTPGAWAAAVAARDVIVSPVTPGVAIPLGLDVGRAAVVGLRDWVGRWSNGSWPELSGISGWVQPARQRFQTWMSEQPVRDWLSSEPLELLAKLWAAFRDRRSG